MLKFDGFLKAELGLVDDPKLDVAKQIRVSYIINSMNHLQNYLKNNAAKMRESGANRFGNKFSAARRIILPLAIKENNT